MHGAYFHLSLQQTVPDNHEDISLLNKNNLIHKREEMIIACCLQNHERTNFSIVILPDADGASKSVYKIKEESTRMQYRRFQLLLDASNLSKNPRQSGLGNSAGVTSILCWVMSIQRSSYQNIQILRRLQSLKRHYIKYIC